jgi:metallophosphoesterase superfamily enzyme
MTVPMASALEVTMRVSFLVVVDVHVEGDETLRVRGAMVPGFLVRVVGRMSIQGLNRNATENATPNPRFFRSCRT